MRKRGPGEAFHGRVGPGEQRSRAGHDDLEPDVEGHGIGDRHPIEGVTHQPTAGHDGIVRMPRTGGEDIPDMGPEGRA